MDFVLNCSLALFLEIGLVVPGIYIVKGKQIQTETLICLILVQQGVESN